MTYILVVIALVCSTYAIQEGVLRLKEGTRSSNGRVEIYYSEEWGTICDNRFDIRDARVVCRQLGYTNQIVRFYGRAHFGRGTGPIFLDGLDCFGSENRLIECQHRGFGANNCNHNEDVGVDCDPAADARFPVRLISSNTTLPIAGRVEIYYQGEWGTVCGWRFMDREAGVVCRQLGVANGTGIYISGAYFGPGTGRVWLDNVVCTGTELGIGACQDQPWGITTCSHTRDVSVICLPAVPVQPADVQLRLADGLSAYGGRLEVAYKGVWGPVCADRFTSDASFFCRAMNMTGQSRLLRSSRLIGKYRPNWMEITQCHGNESHFLDCLKQPFGVTNPICKYHRETVMECSIDTRPALPIRLMQGNESFDGRVELNVGGVWGTICDVHWTSNEAAVACRQAGLSSTGPTPVKLSYFGRAPRSMPIHIQKITCNGTEQSLSQCEHNYYDRQVTWCDDHRRDVGIVCYPAGHLTNGDVRLVDGYSQQSGRVEIFHQNEWGTICGDNWRNSDVWGDANARVICRMKGYSTVGARGYYHHGLIPTGTGRIWLDHIDCQGTESHIAMCRNGGWGRIGSCTHLTDASVVCPGGPSPPAPQVRLVNGTTNAEGRVEVTINNGQTWGTICDYGWSNDDAKVICRMLGLPTTVAFARGRGYFEAGTGNIAYYRVGCHGTETSIDQCSKTSTNFRQCSHRHDVGVSCYDSSFLSNITMRLVDGYSNHSGRVELYYQNEWGTICSDYWGASDARVICRMAGFSTIGARAYSHHGMIPVGTGRIWLDRVGCLGTESHIALCPPHVWGRIGVFCSHTDDASVVCPGGPSPPAPQVRLVNGTTNSEGRVEVTFNNGHTWGTICDTYWSNEDAKVICRMLGLPTDMPFALGRAYFGEGTGHIVYSDVICLGTENSIDECRKTSTNINNCHHYKDAGVTCQDSNFLSNITVRLVDAYNNHSGRVEVFYQNEWGTICGYSWGDDEAKVICRMKGYSTTGARGFYRHGLIPGGTGRIWLNSVYCRDSETHIALCPHGGWGRISTCTHLYDAVVSCAGGASAPEPQIRLVNGSSNAEGRVELTFNNGQTWGTICDDSWSFADARVICRMMGLPTAMPFSRTRAYFGQGNGNIVYNRVGCRGTETSITQCPKVTVNILGCAHWRDAGVSCQDIPTNVGVRLAGGSSANIGRVEIQINNTWGSLCDDGFVDAEAQVICRMLGFQSSGSTVITDGRFGPGAGPIYLDALNCRGNESNILMCLTKEIAYPYPIISCSHSEDVALYCNDGVFMIRLMTGNNVVRRGTAGRVEVAFGDDQWGTICNDGFNNNAAMVVCRMLGLPERKAVATSHSAYGEGPGSIMLDDVTCFGNETSLMDCRHRPVRAHNCDHSADVAVMCNA